jgi:hypothetical protein
MATLKDSYINSDALTINNICREAGSDVTRWYKLNHCQNATSTSICNPTYSCGYLHVRTPIPADNVAMGWYPIIMEVVGQHTYSGEYTHDWKALLNTNGYDNSWYGSQIRVNDSNHSSMNVYRSASTYGSYTRVCFAIPKVGCCCTGALWVRFYNSTGWYDNYPWATAAYNNNSTQVY